MLDNEITYEIHENECLPESSRVIIPVSFGNSYPTGEKFFQFLNKYKSYNPTIVWPDELYRNHNTQVDIMEHIESLWEEYEVFFETEGFNVKKWGEFKDENPEWENKLEKIEIISKENSIMMNKMVRTAKNLGINNPELIKNSINYQKEEYAVLLTWTEFDYIVYPNKISPGMDRLYKEVNIRKDIFGDLELPIFHKVSIRALNTKEMVSTLNYKREKENIYNTKKNKLMPIPLRLVEESLSFVMQSSEISEKNKKLFVLTVLLPYIEGFSSEKEIKEELINITTHGTINY